MSQLPAPVPGFYVNPPAAVTAALHQLQATCAAWQPTTKPPPGADLWTPEAMVCSLATGPGFLHWTGEVFVGAVLATLVCLGLTWGVVRTCRAIVRSVRQHRVPRRVGAGSNL